MLFRQLEYFAAVARERHFGRAAAACFVSQPALSEGIRQLERELGVPLVRRDRAFQGLTPEGERVLVWARRILADHDALGHEVAALRTGLGGDLRIGVVPAASGTVAALTDPLCAEHPLVRIRVETSLASREILERVAGFDLDAGLVYLGAGDTAGLRVLPLYRERHVLVADAALLESAQPIGWAEALSLPLCLLHGGMRGRQLLDAALAARGLAADAQVETDSIVSLVAHVRTGRWASIVPEPWLDALGPADAFRVVRLEDPAVDARIALVASSREPGSVLTQALFRTAETVGFDGGAPPRPPASSARPITR